MSPLYYTLVLFFAAVFRIFIVFMIYQENLSTMVKVRSAFTFSVKNEMHAKQLMTVWCLSVISNRSLGSDGLRPFKFFNILFLTQAKCCANNFLLYILENWFYCKTAGLQVQLMPRFKILKISWAVKRYKSCPVLSWRNATFWNKLSEFFKRLKVVILCHQK